MHSYKNKYFTRFQNKKSSYMFLYKVEFAYKDNLYKCLSL